MCTATRLRLLKSLLCLLLPFLDCWYSTRWLQLYGLMSACGTIACSRVASAHF